VVSPSCRLCILRIPPHQVASASAAVSEFPSSLLLSLPETTSRYLAPFMLPSLFLKPFILRASISNCTFIQEPQFLKNWGQLTPKENTLLNRCHTRCDE